jgi:hypothetical protein
VARGRIAAELREADLFSTAVADAAPGHERAAEQRDPARPAAA